mgnify:CR=1 FL=1
MPITTLLIHWMASLVFFAQSAQTTQPGWRPLEQLVPADAILAIRLVRPADALASPAGRLATHGAVESGKAWAPAALTMMRQPGFPPTLVVVVPNVAEATAERTATAPTTEPVVSDLSPDIVFVCDRTGQAPPAIAFLSPLLAGLSGDVTHGSVATAPEVTAVAVDGRPIDLYWASKSVQGRDLLMLASRSSIVQAWLEGDWPAAPLLTSPAYEAFAPTPGDTPLWAYSSLEPFYALFNPYTASDPMIQQAYWVASIQNFKAAVVTASAGHGEATLTIHLRFEDPNDGLMSLLNGPALPGHADNLARSSPCPVILQSGMTDLAGGIKALNALIGRIAPKVVEEFNQELAAYRKDTGVDLMTDLAARLGGHWSLIVTPLATGQSGTILSAYVAEPAEFIRHHMKHLSLYKVQGRLEENAGWTLFTPDGQGGFAWAMIGQTFLLSWDVEAIRQVAPDRKSGV